MHRRTLFSASSYQREMGKKEAIRSGRCLALAELPTRMGMAASEWRGGQPPATIDGINM